MTEPIRYGQLAGAGGRVRGPALAVGDGAAAAVLSRSPDDGPGVLAWADPDTPDTAHDYCVTAVDERYAESACSASILSFP